MYHTCDISATSPASPHAARVGDSSARGTCHHKPTGNGAQRQHSKGTMMGLWFRLGQRIPIGGGVIDVGVS